MTTTNVISHCVLLTPTQQHSETPSSDRKRVGIRYKTPSTVLHLHVKPSLHEVLKDTSEFLGNPSGYDFSMSIIARRALEQYAERIAAMSKPEVRTEAQHLLDFYR